MKNTFELAHIGINTESEEQALELAKLLSLMFNLEPRHGMKSEFAGGYFECLKSPYLGKNGHVAMITADVESAVKELKEKGFNFLEDTIQLTEDGKLKNIYIDGEFGGFAIHILRK
ncbi:2-dehydro-3-deoxyphosphogluconate aldolase [Streptococcus ratti]|uniref:2-dehydro-3-deoxyphosphogluconate aldolase/4-hydroxy-2-oxoglutarate aldolase n=1 Tax=Streptococcus ratti FA-1 = DSM 20564 TaxID=699248 RepID=A0ABN0GTN9_STRRT|nr:hypothetical protein [Streptococcus ratti]EJN93514.1 2-dehydro-3-deoxyphosphogluconate aldolase/4-hydroxy-2-oxoglutarate aldolase [Streptococcus ratti FA-1 = DSM 20564]EMP71739.1 hypothetical protein D822_00225 [Streptococcus ratti FA-1 = DSM 20564]QEY07390.1 2-dehydro-3-deoxyphosphogluconate aldolase [Streptococcus ratti]VEI59836.1 Uncharacterised protein [Streptococcus mutans]